MIDCLSNVEWITPQTDFLLFLQSYRTGILESFDKFFLSITILGEFFLPTIICAIVYWCIDFRAGVYLFSLESINILIAHFLKMLACVYRPWVLDSRIHPSELAIPCAKGYSFPSGHSAMSASIFGGLAYLLRRKIFWCISLILLVLFVGFSRLWLGVHTPQDVFFGLATGFTLVFAINMLINWAEQNKNRYLTLTVVTDILAILAVICVYCFNSYKLDYLPSGELLVNPESSKYVMDIAFALALGTINGCFLCRRFFPFNPKEISVKRRILRGILGCVGIFLLFKFGLDKIFMNSYDITIAVTSMFLIGFSITFIFPLIFPKLKI